MKKKIFILLALITFIIPFKSFATENQSVNINLYLDKYGNGHFKSIYEYYDDQGTEHYIPIDLQDGIELSEFTVKRNGQPMEYEENWNIDGSFEEKAGKYGIVQTESGVELCYGITEYGENTFTVEYTITDLIKLLNDYDMLYHRFLNPDLSEKPGEINIIIETDEPISEEAVRMWAYGFEGEIHLIDGKVEAWSNEDYRYDHATILLRFDKGYFQAGIEENQDFQYYYDWAMEESSYDTSVDPNETIIRYEKDSFSIVPLISLGIPILLFIIGVFSTLTADNDKLKYNKENIYHDGYYYRDTQDMSIDKFYYILLNLDESSYENYITAYFLKWIKEGRIQLIKDKKGFIFKRDSVSMKLIVKEKDFESSSEIDLFNLMVNASGDDRILQEKEFTRYVSKNTYKFKDFISDLEGNSRRFLIYNGYIETVTEKKLLGQKSHRALSPKGEKLAKELIGFKNYLKDYSLLEEREAINVHLWDEYMIYAGIFGITEEVQKQFSDLYPKYIEESYYDYGTIYWTNHYSNRIASSYNSAVAQASSSSASGGFGGGTSFGGGGGGFSGGGSGGGTR